MYAHMVCALTPIYMYDHMVMPSCLPVMITCNLTHVPIMHDYIVMVHALMAIYHA